MSEIQSNTFASTGIDTPADGDRWAELARMAGRFRILIVGRANAGKTTILKKICNTTDNPDIYDSDGKKIDPLNIEPTAERGIHDIANAMIFRSNPGFIFHDSRGFEAGGVDELQKVEDFLSVCSRQVELKNQVHAIWYCIPMDDSRPITHAEVQFFSTFGTGRVPVIAVFTKCEALEFTAVKILEKKLNYGDAVKRAPDYAKKNLQNAHLDLVKYKYPPRGHVYLQEMEKPHTDCTELVECTASVLDTNTLQAIFVSTQQVSLETQIRYATKSILEYKMQIPMDGEEWIMNLLRSVMDYFPYWTIDGYRYHDHIHVFDPHNIKQSVALASQPMVDAHASSPIQEQIIQLGTAFIIVAEHLYFVWKHHNLASPTAIPTMVIQYQKSPQYFTITRQVAEAIKQYPKAVTKSAAEPEKSIWKQAKGVIQNRKAKNNFEVKPRSALQEKLYTIVLENRLDKTGL